MGMHVASGGGSGRRRSRKARAPMSEINVTPFVDVMLVLLIIFMVTAPLLTVGVPIDLPKTSAKQLGTTNKEPLTITVDKKGRIFLQSREQEIEIGELGAKLTAIAKDNFDEPIYVRGDRDVDFGAVMKVMGKIQASGFRKVSLVTDVEDAS